MYSFTKQEKNQSDENLFSEQDSLKEVKCNYLLYSAAEDSIIPRYIYSETLA